MGGKKKVLTDPRVVRDGVEQANQLRLELLLPGFHAKGISHHPRGSVCLPCGGMQDREASAERSRETTLMCLEGCCIYFLLFGFGFN